jgi:hypothetical protein
MKKIVWALLITASITYIFLVYSWLQEGNKNFEAFRAEIKQRRMQ